MSHHHHFRGLQMYLNSILPQQLTSKSLSLALEEKRIGQVSMNSVSCETFLSSYKKKLKDQFLPIEFKVGSLISNFNQNYSCNSLAPLIVAVETL